MDGDFRRGGGGEWNRGGGGREEEGEDKRAGAGEYFKLPGLFDMGHKASCTKIEEGVRRSEERSCQRRERRGGGSGLQGRAQMVEKLKGVSEGGPGRQGRRGLRAEKGGTENV
eukprot:761845-Hanusia_phi.AAC.4